MSIFVPQMRVSPPKNNKTHTHIWPRQPIFGACNSCVKKEELNNLPSLTIIPMMVESVLAHNDNVNQKEDLDGLFLYLATKDLRPIYIWGCIQRKRSMR